MLKIYKSFIKNTFKFNGYTGRSEYFGIFFTLCALGVLSIVQIIFPIISYIYYLIEVVFAIPFISLHFRRYRDAGIDGYWCLLTFVIPDLISNVIHSDTLLNVLVLICLLVNLYIVSKPAKKQNPLKIKTN